TRIETYWRGAAGNAEVGLHRPDRPVCCTATILMGGPVFGGRRASFCVGRSWQQRVHRQDRELCHSSTPELRVQLSLGFGSGKSPIHSAPDLLLATLRRLLSISARIVYNLRMLDRRRFLRVSVSAASSIAAWAANPPVKIAHREGNMPKKPGASPYELASSIP